MGEWKATVSVRVPQAVRAELEAFAARERRTLGNLGEGLLAWAFAQLKTAGSLNNLLKFQLGRRKDTGKSAGG